MPTRLDISNSVRLNLEDEGVTYFTSTDINDSIQDGYNLYAALSGGILKAATIPRIVNPYWNLSQLLTDYMYPVGIYSVPTNRWLLPKPRRFLDGLRNDWELWNGEPQYLSVIDFRRVCVTPYLTTATGTAVVLYKAKASILADQLVPQIPKQIDNLLEMYATADLLEMGKEYKKAQSYWVEWIASIKKAKNLLYSVASQERLRVLQPYFPMGMYSSISEDDDMHIDNETPTGTINGVNTTFTLAGTPNPAGSLCLCLNGVVLFEGLGYTLSGNTISLTVAPKAPSEEDTQGDKLRAWYRV